jgi:hypothetical protein
MPTDSCRTVINEPRRPMCRQRCRQHAIRWEIRGWHDDGVSDAFDRAASGQVPSGAEMCPLPGSVQALLREVGAPLRLVAHLRAVHDVAVELVAAVSAAFPDVPFDSQAVLLGAATHDIGKAIWPAELDGPGSEHERAGFDLLIRRGWPQGVARFAVTHAAWGEDATTEDLLVSISDKVWKAKRVEDLEDRFISRVGEITGTDRWELFMRLDDILDGLAAGADERLVFQASFPAT